MRCTGKAAFLLLFSAACRGTSSPPPSQATYVGADACAACHQELAGRWKVSGHGNAGSLASDRTVKGDFQHKNVYVYKGVTSRMSIRNGKYFMETEGTDGAYHDYPVDVVLGWVQTQFYVTRFPDGRYQVLPTYWDMKANVWYDQSEGPIFGTGRKLTPKDQQYWANRGSTWNAVCSGCHGSQVEKNFDPATNTYHTTWNDLAINCESCHGPGSRHVEAWTRAGTTGRVDPKVGSLVKLKALPPDRQVEACAKCHAAKTVFARGFQPGDRFLDYYQPAVPLNNKEFYSDGRNRMLNYNYIELIQSRCYLKSTLTCTTCHDPHGSGYYADLKEPQETLDRLCLPCHTQMKAGLQEHTHHPVESAGSRCVGCHMPYMHLGGRLDVRDHTISVPVPAATREFGIPNSCNDCHRDREPQWAADAIRSWFNHDQKERLNATAAFFFGHRKDPGASAALLRLFSDKGALPPARRAAIPMILAKYEDPSLLLPLLPALQDPKEDLLIRFWLTSAYVSASGPMTEQALLYAVTRPERSLRRMAGVELARRGVRPKDRAAARAIQDVAKEYEELVQGVRADVPEDHEYLGDIYLARGEKEKAMERYRFALKLNADLPRAQISLGTLYAERKQVDQAAACFRAAADLIPGSPIPL
ncbi:MAG TPA: ammonia-forming cytochrome c nitrite reductase subunit c552, partial [Candidatus Polarisedimenticolia bacterium]|nr:ammonia-forming cytochrome c nitrite reductase subunit c552 [Candidatus Polarisedimenticolia bacterium]